MDGPEAAVAAKTANAAPASAMARANPHGGPLLTTRPGRQVPTLEAEPQIPGEAMRRRQAKQWFGGLATIKLSGDDTRGAFSLVEMLYPPGCRCRCTFTGSRTRPTTVEQNPWLLGLEYVGVRPRKALPHGAMDFILERYDGFHDLLELKSPQDPIVLAPDAVDDVPPPAHDFALSPDLAQALAQVHVYRDVLSADEAVVSKFYGLRNTRNPRVFIVIGQSAALPSHRARVLRDLNLTLHRMEVVPYDVLGQRAETMLNNVERHLSASKSEE